MIKQGFRVMEASHTEALEKLIREEAETIELQDKYFTVTHLATPLEKELAAAKFRLGVEYARQGKNVEALQELDEALLHDRDNFLIRKQRWFIRYPEKFSPTIDIEWQQKQLEQEKLAEQNCGPEGCQIPGTN
jgi:hypothetical protein